MGERPRGVSCWVLQCAVVPLCRINQIMAKNLKRDECLLEDLSPKYMTNASTPSDTKKKKRESSDRATTRELATRHHRELMHHKELTTRGARPRGPAQDGARKRKCVVRRAISEFTPTN